MKWLFGLFAAVLCIFPSIEITAQSDPVVITMWPIATEGDPFRPVLQGAIANLMPRTPTFALSRGHPNEAYKARLAQSLSESASCVFTPGRWHIKAFVEQGLVREVAGLNGELQIALSPTPSPLQSLTKNYAVPANLAGIFSGTTKTSSRNITFRCRRPGRDHQRLQAFRQVGITPMPWETETAGARFVV